MTFQRRKQGLHIHKSAIIQWICIEHPPQSPSQPIGMHCKIAEGNLLGPPAPTKHGEQRTGWTSAPTGPSAGSSGAVDNLYNLPWHPCSRHCVSCWRQSSRHRAAFNLVGKTDNTQEKKQIRLFQVMVSAVMKTKQLHVIGRWGGVCYIMLDSQKRGNSLKRACLSWDLNNFDPPPFPAWEIQTEKPAPGSKEILRWYLSLPWIKSGYWEGFRPGPDS